MDNLSVLRHQLKANTKRIRQIKEMLEQEKPNITPLDTFAVGLKVYFIIDEVRNFMR